MGAGGGGGSLEGVLGVEAAVEVASVRGRECVLGVSVVGLDRRGGLVSSCWRFCQWINGIVACGGVGGLGGLGGGVGGLGGGLIVMILSDVGMILLSCRCRSGGFAPATR